MGSSWNPFEILENIIEHTFDMITNIIRGRIDKAIGDAVRLGFSTVGLEFHDEYRDVIQVDAKAYNIIGFNKPDKFILNTAMRSHVTKSKLPITFKEDILNGGAARFYRFLHWAHSTNNYDSLGIKVSQLGTRISEQEVQNIISEILGQVEYLRETPNIGSLIGLRLQVAFTYCIRNNIDFNQFADVQVLDITNGLFLLTLRDGQKYTFNCRDLGLDPTKEYATCIYRPLTTQVYYKSEESSFMVLPRKPEETFTKIFIRGKDENIDTYTIYDASDEIPISPLLINSFEYEDFSYDDEETGEEVNARRYTIKYQKIDTDNKEYFDKSNPVYFTFDENTFETYKYTRISHTVPSGSYDTFWYIRGTGYPVIDNIWDRALGKDDMYNWAPIFCLRTFTYPITLDVFRNYYNLAKKSAKKLVGYKKFYDKIADQVNSNPSAKDIDFAYVIMGIPLNRKEKYSIEYICRFFIYFAQYSNFFGSTSYSNTFDPQVSDTGKVTLCETRFGKVFNYGIDMQHGVGAYFNWNLIWQASAYTTYSEPEEPSSKFWITTGYVSKGAFEITDEYARVALVFEPYGTLGGYGARAFLATDMPLDTSLMQLETSGTSENIVGFRDSNLCMHNTAWISKGNLVTRKWHICSQIEANYLLTYHDISFKNILIQFFLQNGLFLYEKNIGENIHSSHSSAFLFLEKPNYDFVSKLDRLDKNLMSQTRRQTIYLTDGDTRQETYEYLGCDVTFDNAGNYIIEHEAFNNNYFGGFRQAIIKTVRAITPLPQGPTYIFHHKINGKLCEKATISGLRIQNEIIPEFVICYDAIWYLNYADTNQGTCPFIIPLNSHVLHEMSAVHQNELLQVSYNVLINIFVKETVVIPWYATEAFQTCIIVVRIVVTVVLTIFTGPGAAAFNSIWELVMHVATQIAIAAFVTVISKIVSNMISNPILKMVIENVLSIVLTMGINGALNGFNFNFFGSSDSLMTSILNWASKPMNWAKLGAKALNGITSQKTQATVEELNTIQKENQEIMQKQQDLNNQIAAMTYNLDNSQSITSNLAWLLVKDPKYGMDIYYSTSNPSEIYDISQSIVYNFYDYKISTSIG